MDSGRSRQDLSARHQLFGERGLRYMPRRAVVPDVTVVPPVIRPTEPGVSPQTTGRSMQDIVPALPRQQKAKVLARVHRLPKARSPHSIEAVSATNQSADVQVSVPKPALPRQRKSQVLARRITGKAAYYQKQAEQSKRKQRLAFIGGGLAMMTLTIAGMIIFGQVTHSPDDQSAPPATLGARTMNGGIDEAPVSTDSVVSHRAPALEPVRISIPRIGVIARIFAVAPDQTGQPAPTENIYDIGWLKSSAKPGEGVTVLNGYQNGPTRGGSLEQIKVLAPGDVLQVERGDGQQIKYIVTKLESYAADAINVPALVKGAADTKSGLVVVTNQGRFSIRENRFESRTVLWAVAEQ